MQSFVINIDAITPASKAQVLLELASIINECTFLELGRLNNNWSGELATIRITTEQVPA